MKMESGYPSSGVSFDIWQAHWQQSFPLMNACLLNLDFCRKYTEGGDKLHGRNGSFFGFSLCDGSAEQSGQDRYPEKVTMASKSDECLPES